MKFTSANFTALYRAERGMAMKGKNLERAVILGLLLSAGIYGTVWAAEYTEGAWHIDPDNPKKLIIDNATKVIRSDNTFGGKSLGDFDVVEIIYKPTGSSGENRAFGVYSARYNIPNTNITVTVEDKGTTNNDALHLTNHYTEFNVGNFTAHVKSKGSDIFNISRDNTTNSGVTINGNITGIVECGNGLRANASIKGDNKATITINGDTNITVNADSANDAIVSGLTDRPVYTTAVWAGTETYYDSDYADGSYVDVIPFFWKGQYNKKSEGQGIIDLQGNTILTLNGKGNFGILAGKNGHIIVNNLYITANKQGSYGISAAEKNITYGSDDSDNIYGSSVTMNGSKNIITMANGGTAIYAQGKDINNNSNTVKSGENGIGGLNVKGNILAEDSGAIDLTINNDKITDDNNNVYENYVIVEGDILAKTAGTINMAVKNTAGITGNIEAVGTDSKINIGGISAVDGQSVMRVSDDNSGATSINITGNVQAANGGEINLSLGDGAYFAGRVDDYKDADADNKDTWNNIDHGSLFDEDFVNDNRVNSSGKVNLTLGNSSTWFVTEQSWATNVNTNNSIIDLTKGNNQNYAVHIGELNGNSTFIVNLDPNTQSNINNGNMIYVYNGTGAENLNLLINNETEVLSGLADGEKLRFATVKKAGHGFGDTYVARGRGVINSGFSIEYENYDTANSEENDKYNGGTDFNASKPGSYYVNNIYEDGENVYLVRDTSKDAGVSDSGATILNMSRANYKNAIYMDRLNKRMGEARYINGEEEQGMWVRLRHDRIGQSGDFRSMNTMYELGYDVKQPIDNGEHRIGMAIDYMRGSTSYNDIIGKGETKRYGLWLYDTWLGDKGHYTDYIVKWGHLSNDFDIRDKDSLENITGDYSNNVFSVSAEYGKKNDMGSSWYFEPQAQLQLARVTGADYVTTQGSKVSVDGINSLIGRAGFRIGRDMTENSTVYVKADLLHEFWGDQTVTASDATGTLREEFENKGTWYDVGFGCAAQTGKNSYAFVDFEKSFGNDNDETYQINAGLQWSF